MFDRNEIVRVAYQPYNQRQVVGDFIGKVGYIEELNEDHSRALLQCLTKDGKLAGAAWLPIKCLVRESSQDWHDAYNKDQEWFKQITIEAKTRQSRRAMKLTELASRYSLSIHDVLEISQQLESLA
jgi:hypothetical protein